MNSIFSSNAVFNQDISGWDVSNLGTMQAAFFRASAFNQDLSSWDVSNVFNMIALFDESGLSTINYDAVLNSWSQQALQSDVNLGADGINFCNGSAGRDRLINDFNWTITDSGEDCTQVAQTITFNPIEDQFLEAGSITLTAAASSVSGQIRVSLDAN